MKKLIFILIGLIVLSCQDIENCGTDDNIDFIIFRFFDKETQESKSAGFTFAVDGSPYQWRFLADTSIVPGDTTITPADTMMIDDEIVITPADTVIVLADTTIVSDSTFILLPLNPLTPSTTFFFDSDTSSHFVELSYDTELSIFDPACNPSLTFTNIDTVRQSFDSTVVVGSVTNRQISTNVEVYF